MHKRVAQNLAIIKSFFKRVSGYQSVKSVHFFAISVAVIWDHKIESMPEIQSSAFIRREGGLETRHFNEIQSFMLQVYVCALRLLATQRMFCKRAPKDLPFQVGTSNWNDRNFIFK